MLVDTVEIQKIKRDDADIAPSPRAGFSDAHGAVHEIGRL
jgi:hypothetical protein